jgi:hypothetical protein
VRQLLFLFVLCASAASAQSTVKLDSDLAGLAKADAPIAAIATRVTDDILALADNDARPSRKTTLDFSIALTKALAGKPVSPAGLERADSAILAVLQSSGVPSARFHASIEDFRAALVRMLVAPAAATDAANQLMILGQEVRGPEGIKLDRLR